MAQLTFTFDLEDPRPHEHLEQRFVEPTMAVVDLLEQTGIRGTFFVVATTASSAPELVRTINNRGHEIALHSFDHTPLVELDADTFRQSTIHGRDILQDLIGAPIAGYRAPNFSLTPQTPWAPEILRELGFRYSSSVLPAAHVYHGYAHAPRGKFRWPGGLVEIPAPVTKLGPFTLPFLGGIYFRYLPLMRIIKRLDQNPDNWFYCHPYDFDPDQPYYRMWDTSHWASILLWLKRRDSLAKLKQLLTHPACQFLPPFADQALGEPPFFTPPASG